jgi:hypothetical protein
VRGTLSDLRPLGETFPDLLADRHEFCREVGAQAVADSVRRANIPVVTHARLMASQDTVLSVPAGSNCGYTTVHASVGIVRLIANQLHLAIFESTPEVRARAAARRRRPIVGRE